MLASLCQGLRLRQRKARNGIPETFQIKGLVREECRVPQITLDQINGCSVDEYFTRGRLLAQARRKVDRLTDGGIFKAAFTTDDTDRHRAARHTNTDTNGMGVG